MSKTNYVGLVVKARPHWRTTATAESYVVVAQSQNTMTLVALDHNWWKTQAVWISDWIVDSYKIDNISIEMLIERITSCFADPEGFATDNRREAELALPMLKETLARNKAIDKDIFNLLTPKPKVNWQDKCCGVPLKCNVGRLVFIETDPKDSDMSHMYGEAIVIEESAESMYCIQTEDVGAGSLGCHRFDKKKCNFVSTYDDDIFCHQFANRLRTSAVSTFESPVDHDAAKSAARMIERALQRKADNKVKLSNLDNMWSSYVGKMGSLSGKYCIQGL